MLIGTMLRGYATRLGLALLALFLLGLSTSSAVPPRTVMGVARSYLYSLPGWEVRNLWGKWLFLLGQPFRGGLPRETEARAQIREFFRLGNEVAAAQRELERASIAGSDQKPSRERLEAAEAQRARLRPEVEALLEAKITRALAEEGLVLGLGPWEVVFPPVDFTFSPTPQVLVVSPRNRIEISHAILLVPGLTGERREAVETGVEALGLSAVVEPIGGVATYPSIIPQTTPLEASLTTAAHEWLHHYLFFHPLGRAYRHSDEMTTLNETLADLAGQEIGRRVLRGLFPELVPPESPPPPPTPAPLPAFDFNREMHQTRLQVEALLARGEVDAAEAYMRERQQFLAQHGYYIRRLNQAYFAFHGTYADTPASMSPVAGLLRRLRESSPSLGAFVRSVAGVSTYQEFLELVEAG